MRLSLYIIVLSFFFCACINEYEVDGIIEGPQMVVKAELNASGENREIYFTTTFNDLSEPIVFDAPLEVELFEEGNPTPIILVADQNDNSVYHLPDTYTFQQGVNYFLEAESPTDQIGPIKSETLVPNTTIYDSIDVIAVSDKTLQLGIHGPYENRYLHILVSMQDDKGNSLQLTADPAMDTLNAVTVLKNRNGILLDHELLSEDKYLTFQADFLDQLGLESVKGQISYISIRSVNEDYYLYNRSISLQRENLNNPFSLPTTTFTNITNGYGLFSVYSAVDTAVVIE